MAWLKNGDEYTSMFHKVIKQRRLQNIVYGIHSIDGEWVKGMEIENAFISYYQQLLGTAKSCAGRISSRACSQC